jgi:hypothetical protein
MLNTFPSFVNFHANSKCFVVAGVGAFAISCSSYGGLMPLGVAPFLGAILHESNPSPPSFF